MATRLVIIAGVLSLLSAATADRAHGLANESPVAISPQAYAFFHPNAAMQPTASAMPLATSAATVKSTPAHESASTDGAAGGIGAGGIAGICMSVVIVCVVGMGAYSVIKKRRDNSGRAEQQPPPPTEV